MSTKPFVYQDPFPLAHDDTEYYLLSKEHVSVAEFDGQQVLKVEPQALTLLAQQAFHDAAFMLRVSHQQQVGSILLDPEASDNDKYVAPAIPAQLGNCRQGRAAHLPGYRHRDYHGEKRPARLDRRWR